MKRNYLKYLLLGILVVGTQEVWVAWMWRGDFRGFVMAILILEVIFFTLTFLIGKVIDRIFKGRATGDIIAYIIFGLIGLIVIEWSFAGTVPSTTHWFQQIVMFTTWGGGAVVARMYTESLPYTDKIKKYLMRFFLPPIIIATLVGFIFLKTAPQVTFVVTLATAWIIYPLLNIFFVWYFAKKIRNQN